MSASAYRMQKSNPRLPPPPLNFQQSPFTSSTPSSPQHTPQTLLYDLPSASSMTPPTSPKSKGRLMSPTSPTFSTHSASGRRSRPTPPPSARHRSTTPSTISSSELEKFAEQCRAWYFQQDESAGRLMTQTLTTLQASQRAPYARLQASIRSEYHHSVNARKTAEFQAHLTATQPGGSLMPHARANPHGSLARKERHERMDRFLRNWCTMGMPGTKPFFEALWAIIRLQVIPENLGGAGPYRIDWELDDAVFKESAGKDFMLEAVDVLKGVLGFEERRSARHSSALKRDSMTIEASTTHSRSESQPLSSDKKSSANVSKAVSKRPRAPSDPFLDSPGVSASVGSSTTHLSGRTAITSSASQSEEDPPGAPYGTSPVFDESDEEYIRIWTSPDLSNPELMQLLKLFPPFITRRALPRFPTAVRQPDIEEGDDEGLEGRQIHFGTGSLWVSDKSRSDGWQGGWWTRFILWWRRVFC